jgi:hypothetical protein
MPKSSLDRDLPVLLANAIKLLLTVSRMEPFENWETSDHRAACAVMSVRVAGAGMLTAPRRNGARRVDDRRVNDGAGRHRQAMQLQMPTHLLNSLRPDRAA